MHEDKTIKGATPALLLEREPLVRERACLMLEEEGYAPCAVGATALFEELQRLMPASIRVLGVTRPDQLLATAEEEGEYPLLLLVPLEDRSLVAHLRVRVPHARLVDRRLREPDSIHRALAPSPEPPPGGKDPAGAIRRAFAPFGLSERQLQVVELALLGLSSGEIARQIYVSEMTVRNHLHAIYGRVGVTGRRELLGRFVRGLLEGET
jgi:DNA-binding CsgD family transcriptional regulator